MSNADATIIIPQFNQPELTCACIHSLRQHNPCLWPIIVVDDGSSPECSAVVAARDFAETRLIQQPHRGVAAAWNRGAVAARTPYLVFLNNDVLAEGKAIGNLIMPLSTGRYIVSGIRRRRETALPAETLQKLPTDLFLEGWCFATTAEAFERVGGFDETMAAYWSDTDFQSRLIAIDGHTDEPMVCVPHLPLRHLGHRTTHRLPKYHHVWQADRATFIAKWNSMKFAGC